MQFRDILPCNDVAIVWKVKHYLPLGYHWLPLATTPSVDDNIVFDVSDTFRGILSSMTG